MVFVREMCGGGGPRGERRRSILRSKIGRRRGDRRAALPSRFARVGPAGAPAGGHGRPPKRPAGAWMPPCVLAGRYSAAGGGRGLHGWLRRGRRSRVAAEPEERGRHAAERSTLAAAVLREAGCRAGLVFLSGDAALLRSAASSRGGAVSGEAPLSVRVVGARRDVRALCGVAIAGVVARRARRARLRRARRLRAWRVGASGCVASSASCGRRSGVSRGGHGGAACGCAGVGNVNQSGGVVFAVVRAHGTRPLLFNRPGGRRGASLASGRRRSGC